MSTHRIFADTDLLFVHPTQPAALDCPVVQAELSKSRKLFRKLVRQLGNQVHPDPEPAPAGLAKHVTPTGERMHELGWTVSVIAASVGSMAVMVAMRMGWLQ